jgi:hypothetical protein
MVQESEASTNVPGGWKEVTQLLQKSVEDAVNTGSGNAPTKQNSNGASK